MDAHDLRDAMRRSWWLILLTAATCAVAAMVYTQRLESRYESHTQLFVAGPERESSIRRAPSYAGLLTSPNVTAPVVRALALPDTPGGLASRLTGSAPPDTVLINLTVADSNPVRARRTSQAVADRLIKLVEQLERPSRPRVPGVRLFVSSPASLPAKRISPNPLVNITASVVLGLILGLVAAVLRRRLDRRIFTPQDLPDQQGYGVLATVPIGKAAGELPSPDRGPLVDHERAEAMRRLRTNLRFLEPDSPPGIIVVTSSLPGEGATTTAVGLATAMAEAGSDIVLIEADLRRPRFTEHLSLRDNEGVAGHLVTATPVERLLQPCSVSHADGRLRVLAAGPAPLHPSELLSSQRMRELLADLRSRCEVVIVDTPPLLSFTDAAVLAGEADGVLLVVRMGRLTQPELERALDALTHARARVLGFVANGVATSGRHNRRQAYPTTSEPATPRPRSPRLTTPPKPANRAAPPSPRATSDS